MSYTPGTWESGARIHSTGREPYRKPKTPRLFEPIPANTLWRDVTGIPACNGCGAEGKLYEGFCGKCQSIKAREAKQCDTPPGEVTQTFKHVKSASPECIAPLVEETEPQESDGWKLTTGWKGRWEHPKFNVVALCLSPDTTRGEWYFHQSHFNTQTVKDVTTKTWQQGKAALIAAGVLK